MPLYDGYGVLVGTLQKYYCDNVFSDRNYYHCNLKVRAGSKFYRCPVDLDSKQDAHGIEWRVVELAPAAFQHLLHLPEGWHPLESDSDSGALDYYRTPAFWPTCTLTEPDSDTLELREAPSRCDPWKYGTGFEAFKELEPLLSHSRRVFVFGEPFRSGNGVHNIHQNQGDPPESQWHHENGVWQDGGVIVYGRDHRLDAFLCKFNTQSFFPYSS